MTDVLERIARQRVVPVLRSTDVQDAIATARACAAAGMEVVELTHSTPNVEAAVRALADEQVVIGVGTITSAAQVEAAVTAGAGFVVSFTAPAGMVAAARSLGVPAIPGALTPTEVAGCLQSGAAAVKLFPARGLAPAYLRDLRAVLGDFPAIVTGGLQASAASIVPWLQAGALAVGLGGDLGTVAADGAQEVQRRARAALAAAAPTGTGG
jgi:2-dehydro-3-deoxyphosphogluconate aldolase/(4S)-4-hydroxy-2-oxoglutarate aldolase